MSSYASCELNFLTGFLTTFTMLARDRLSLRQMSWILVKVFFGYVGEDFLFPTALLTDNARQIECLRICTLLPGYSVVEEHY
jgi:hypothetical protein